MLSVTSKLHLAQFHKTRHYIGRFVASLSRACFEVNCALFLQANVLQLLCRYKAFNAWAKEVDKKPAPKSPLSKQKKRTTGQEDSQQALVAAIRLVCWNIRLGCARRHGHVHPGDLYAVASQH